VGGWKEWGREGKFSTLTPWVHFPPQCNLFLMPSMLLVEQNSLSALDYPVLAQQSSLVGLGRAELTLYPQATPLNPHNNLRHRALRGTGGGGIAQVQDKRSSGMELLPQTSQLTSSLQCGNAALRQTPYQEQCGNSARAARGNQTRAVHACWPN